MNKEKLLELYPDYTSVLGPYTRPDGRKHIVLNNSNASKGTKGKTKTISYPKALKEIELERKLNPDETVDHHDEVKTNDDITNLQILSREDNARKSAFGNKHACGRFQTHEDIRNFRQLFNDNKITQQEIIAQTGMNEKTVRNFLTGKTYSNID